MEQRSSKAPTPGAVGNRGVGSIAVLGDGPKGAMVLRLYMAEYYQWMREEASE